MSVLLPGTVEIDLRSEQTAGAARFLDYAYDLEYSLKVQIGPGL